MKILLYTTLVVLLVPLHTTLLPHMSVWGIKPDVGLVVAALIGLLMGELEGLVVGLAIGWVLNMYSAGDLWLSLVTKGGAGLLAGLFGRQVAHVTPLVLCVGLLVLSFGEGIMAVSTMKAATVSHTWCMFQSVIVPQACLDAALGTGLFWMASRRMVFDHLRVIDR